MSNTLNNMFWKWMAFSVLALVLAAAIPAMSADVFIDEGDGDFAPATAPAAPTADQSLLDAADAVANEPNAVQAPVEQAAAKVEEKAKKADVKKDVKAAAKKAEAKKSIAKAEKKESKKVAKADKKGSKKSEGKKSVAKNDAKGKKVAKNKKAGREVASFQGGAYHTTTKECSLQSAPAAGDSLGVAKAGRKLWVEDAGDAGYWKAYNKAGQAVFIGKDCF